MEMHHSTKRKHIKKLKRLIGQTKISVEEQRYVNNLWQSTTGKHWSFTRCGNTLRGRIQSVYRVLEPKKR